MLNLSFRLIQERISKLQCIRDQDPSSVLKFELKPFQVMFFGALFAGMLAVVIIIIFVIHGIVDQFRSCLGNSAFISTSGYISGSDF